jgi:hypothetical protein
MRISFLISNFLLFSFIRSPSDIEIMQVVNNINYQSFERMKAITGIKQPTVPYPMFARETVISYAFGLRNSLKKT